jgi:hypothetical protein
MKRLLIVGAGVAGCAAKRIADEFGWHTTLVDVDQRRAASNAALATIRPQWLGTNGKQIAERSWRWYEKWGATVTRTAIVSSYSTTGSKRQPDWWLVDPVRVLVEPDVQQQIDHMWDDSDGVHARINEQAHTFSAALIATGAYDKRFISEFREQYGATLIRPDTTLAEPLYVHHLRPYHSLTVGCVNNVVRLGSSVANNEQKAIDEVWEMLATAEKLGIVRKLDGWQVALNVRAKAKQIVEPNLGRRIARIGNLGRSGYGYAPHLISSWLGSLT